MTDRSPQPVGMQTQTDVGLRNFMLGTYRWMAVAMAFAGAVAFYFANNPAFIYSLFSAGPFVPLIAVAVIFFGFMFVGRALPRMSKGAMIAFLFAMAGILGMFFSASLIVYPGMLIAKVFFMTVALFGTLSLFGYTTQKNLWGIAKYAAAIFMGGIVYLLLSNFVPSMAPTGGMEMIFSLVMLVAIAILVAWETQAMKAMYYGSVGNTALMQKLSIFGAASLLLSFYNMFQFLLNIMGSFGE